MIRNLTIKFLEGLQMLIQRDIDNVKTLQENSIMDYMLNKSYCMNSTNDEFLRIMNIGKKSEEDINESKN